MQLKELFTERGTKPVKKPNGAKNNGSDLGRNGKSNGNGNGHGNGNGNGDTPTFHFAAVEQLNVPHGRKGKHRTMVSRILEDLSNRNEQQAVRVPLASLQGEKIQNLRSALNRVSRLKKLPIATSSDEKYLYIWNTSSGDGGQRGSEGNQT